MKLLRIRKERISREWTLEYVGKYVGITKQSASAIETGNSKPSYETLCKLEILFSLPHHKLFELADDETFQAKNTTPANNQSNAI